LGLIVIGSQQRIKGGPGRKRRSQRPGRGADARPEL